MNKLRLISEYCVGCGLCKAKGTAEVRTNAKGFYQVVSGDVGWLEKVCPCGGMQTRHFSGDLWGHYEKVFFGWSNDANVRKQASSGGALTELAAYLLESKTVEGIIHTQFDPKDPTKTISCISTTRGDLIRRCGSRYSVSHPLEIIEDIDLSKRYAFIGKPCDVDALTNAFSLYPELRSSIVCTMSFFCAGVPSYDAQDKLLKAFGCKKEKCRFLRYRGDGWPGFATACDNEGNEYKMDYDSSWGKILGRDIMPVCRICMNGIGESADIACADGWYLTEDSKPDFSEGDGRNVIFARTKAGLEIVERAAALGHLHTEDFSNAQALLPKMQYAQAGRRQSLLAKKAAMKLCLRPFPKYSTDVMKRYSKTAPLTYRLKFFKGTIKRIIDKSI